MSDVGGKLLPLVPPTGDNPGWTPHIARELVKELQALGRTNAQMRDVLGDIFAELQALRRELGGRRKQARAREAGEDRRKLRRRA